MPWKVEFLNAVAQAEVEALPADLRARFVRIGELIEAHGLERVGEPCPFTLRDGLGPARDRVADFC